MCPRTVISPWYDQLSNSRTVYHTNVQLIHKGLFMLQYKNYLPTVSS